MNVLYAACAVAVGLIVASLALIAWRLLKGPSAADRVIATDMLSLLGLCAAALVAVLADHSAYLDVGLGIAVFGFLGAVAFAGLLERAGIQDKEES